jgi:hypothetical protein
MRATTWGARISGPRIRGWRKTFHGDVPPVDPPPLEDHTPPEYDPDGSWKGLAGRGQTQWYDTVGAGVGGPTQIARIPMEANNINTAEGVYNWTSEDAQVEAALDNGIVCLIGIYYVAKWTTNPAWTDKRVPSDPEDYDAWMDTWISTFAEKVFNRYHKDGNAKASFINASNYVEFYEIWNEPNWGIFWQEGPQSGSPSQYGPLVADKYAELLKRTYIAAKTISTDIKIGNGGMAVLALSYGNGARIKSWLWIEDMFAYWSDPANHHGLTEAEGGWHPYLALDFICTHSYWYGRPGASSTYTAIWGHNKDVISNSFANDLPMIHNVAVDHGGAGLKIWITECGFPTHQTAVTGYGVRRGTPPTSANDERKFLSPTESYNELRGQMRVSAGTNSWPTGTTIAKWAFDGTNNRGHLRSGPVFYFSVQDFDQTPDEGTGGFYEIPFPHEEHMGLYDKDGTPKTGYNNAPGVAKGWPTGVKTKYDAYWGY